MTQRILNDSDIAKLFAALGEQRDFVYLDSSMPDRGNRRSLLFTEPVEWLRCRGGENRRGFLDQVEKWLARGFYLCGWLGYEFLHAEHAIGLKDVSPLLAELGVFENLREFDHLSGASTLPFSDEPAAIDLSYRVSGLHPVMDEERYCRAIDRILEYIAAGDTYQVNYTFKLHFGFDGSVQGLYRDLRRSQPVPYGCFFKSGDRHILSFSPELFFRMNSERITARPMKGTMKRGRFHREDEEIARKLYSDVKNRSENVMIVDLLRNDLSRLVDNTGGGEVRVESLFDVERYRTVYQMTSTIVANRFAHNHVAPARILEAIFPCGSVTGAPKIRTMQIIDELELESRGVYTGAIGYFGPQGEAVFNVPIRTVVVDGKRGEMGIGSGIVADSSPRDEWRECMLKARFLTSPPPRFKLFETLLFVPGSGYFLLEEHLARIKGSADYLGLICDSALIRNLLDRQAREFSGAGCKRVRMLLADDGEAVIEVAGCERPLAFSLEEARRTGPGLEGLIDFFIEPTDSSSRWLFHKTTRREQYDRAWRQADSEGLNDFVFCNEKGEITEGAISNVIVERNGECFTPPVTCGLLPGVMRTHLLSQSEGMKLREKVLYRQDLRRADRIYLCNSVRGVVAVRLR